VAGSTNGDGDSFGVDPDQEDDWDGYVAFVNTLTGALESSVRIASQAGKNDFIQDICVYGDYMYMVGTTEGTLDLGSSNDAGGGAFVLKMDLRSLDFEYKLTISGMKEAVKCVATAEGAYVGFYVSKTASVPEAVINSQDVVVTKFGADLRDSDAIWSHWLDTTEANSNDIRQDFLVGMEVLDSGNVAILLNSVNLEAGLNDIVVLDLDKDTGVNDLTKGEMRPTPRPSAPSVPKDQDARGCRRGQGYHMGSDCDSGLFLAISRDVPFFLKRGWRGDFKSFVRTDRPGAAGTND